MHPHRSLPTKLPRLRVGSRLQPTPAAASTDQQNHPDSSRLVCHSGSGPMRAGPPLPCRQNHRIRSAREFVRIGAWGAATRCALGFGRRLRREPCARVQVGCNRRRHGSSGERSSARRSLPASTRGDPPDEAFARGNSRV